MKRVGWEPAERTGSCRGVTEGLMRRKSSFSPKARSEAAFVTPLEGRAGASPFPELSLLPFASESLTFTGTKIVIFPGLFPCTKCLFKGLKKKKNQKKPQGQTLRR